MPDDTTASAWLANPPATLNESDLYAIAASVGDEPSPRGGMSLQDRLERDEMVRFSVKHLRMTATQVWQYSQCWKHPFYDEQGVWRRINALKLRGSVKRVAEQSLHELFTIKICLKIWQDAHRNGFPVTGIEKESRLPGAGIRADMRFMLGHRLFFVEHQRSVLTYMGWRQKLGKYVRFRKGKGIGPFRVLITMDNESNLNTVYRYAKEVTREHPELCLFLLAWQPDLLGQYDTTTEPVWVSNRLVNGRPETVALMEKC